MEKLLDFIVCHLNEKETFPSKVLSVITILIKHLYAKLDALTFYMLVI